MCETADPQLILARPVTPPADLLVRQTQSLHREKPVGVEDGGS